MRTKAKTILMRMGTMVASLALVITAANINSTCLCIAHQPKLPESAKKLRKI